MKIIDTMLQLENRGLRGLKALVVKTKGRRDEINNH